MIHASKVAGRTADDAKEAAEKADSQKNVLYIAVYIK